MRARANQYGYPEGFRSVVVIAKVGASRDETKTQARKSSQLCEPTSRLSESAPEEAPHLTVHDLLDEPACSQSSLSRRAHNDDRALPALSADRVLAVSWTIWSMVQEMMRIGLL